MSSSEPAPRPSAIHRLQVQAFLDAAEDVDVDEETIEDLLEGCEDEEPHAHDAELRPDAEEAFEPEENDGFDDPEYLALVEESNGAWSPQEMRGMKHSLKEKGMHAFLQEYAVSRRIPIPKLLYAFDVVLCNELRMKKPKTLIFFLRVAMSQELHRRERLASYNTIEDAVNLIRSSRRIVILTGAGISVSCGIPDFRSRNGLYAMLKQRGEYELDDPQQMFDLNYFRENPSVFYSFASQIYPSNFTPSPCHRFIKLMEDRGCLLRNYTQNIDTLENLAGVQKVLQCHGSFTTASCLECRVRVPIIEIEQDIFARRIPYCKACNPPPGSSRRKADGTKPKPKPKAKSGWGPNDENSGRQGGAVLPGTIMKPDIIFFGEKLSDVFDQSLASDREQLDLLLVIGTSLKVAPVADMLLHIPHSIPQILINKTPVRHMNADIVLLGDADAVIQDLCSRLQWELPPAVGTAAPRAPRENLRKRPSTGPSTPAEEVAAEAPKRVANSHVWLFPGAEGGDYVESIEQLARIDEESDLSSLEASPRKPTPRKDIDAFRQAKKRKTA